MTTTERRHRRRARRHAGPRTISLAIIAALTMLVSPTGLLGATAADAQTPVEEAKSIRTKRMLGCAAALIRHSYEPETGFNTNRVRQDCSSDIGPVRLQDSSDVAQVWLAEPGLDSQSTRRTLMIANRGSSSAGDWARNAESQFSGYTDYEGWNGFSNQELQVLGRVDSGFHKRARIQWNRLIKSQIDQHIIEHRGNTAILVTGHSLGGATTTILAPVIKLYMQKTQQGDRGKFKRHTIALPFNAPKSNSGAATRAYQTALTDTSEPDQSPGVPAELEALFFVQVSRNGDIVPPFPLGLNSHAVWNAKEQGCTLADGSSGWKAIQGRRFSDSTACVTYKPHVRLPRRGGINHLWLDKLVEDINDLDSRNDIRGLGRFPYSWGNHSD